MEEIRKCVIQYYNAYTSFMDDDEFTAHTENGLLILKGIMDTNANKPYVIMVAPEVSFDRWSVNGTKYNFITKEECISFLKEGRELVYFQAFKDLSEDYRMDIDMFGESKEKSERSVEPFLNGLGV